MIRDLILFLAPGSGILLIAVAALATSFNPFRPRNHGE